MISVALGAVTNIVLDPVFIFVLDMGVAGAAFATVLSQLASAVFVFRFLRGNRVLLRQYGVCGGTQHRLFSRHAATDFRRRLPRRTGF